MSDLKYSFWSDLRTILNSKQSRTVVVSGNIHDLFWDGAKYVPLVQYMKDKAKPVGYIQIVLELNGPLRMSSADRAELKNAWCSWKADIKENEYFRVLMQSSRKQKQLDNRDKEFEFLMEEAMGNSTLALELLRQITYCSRERLKKDVLIFIEAADMLLPSGDGDIAKLSDVQLRRIAISQDWFGDPDFCNSGDAVILIAESASGIQPRLVRMPQITTVEVDSPDQENRVHFFKHFCDNAQPSKPRSWSGDDPVPFAESTASLSIYALRQLLQRHAYTGDTITQRHVITSVEEFIQQQLGEDVVEFSKPSHLLKDCVGFSQLKGFFKSQLIPRFNTGPDKALPGALVAGPIGSGKTFLMEAVAAELGLPVLMLKGIRSQWFGQTDAIFERLRRVLNALNRAVIFIDEADTQFGSVSVNAHDTEKRLTGKIQAMMSDMRLRGKIFWLLMTARPHLLSPDIRRPGRVGSLIIPVLDPSGEDRTDFIKWVCGGVRIEPDEKSLREMDKAIGYEYSSASFAELRSYLKSMPEVPKDVDGILAAMEDFLPSNIGKAREYQRLQALVNCTRKSLLPNGENKRDEWNKKITELELDGIK